MDKVRQKVLLVTGGGRGIGAATARLAAQLGWTVAVNYTANSLAADEVVRQIRASGGARNLTPSRSHSPISCARISVFAATPPATASNGALG